MDSAKLGSTSPDRGLELLNDNFFDHYWRRRPTVFRGAVPQFLRHAPSRAEIKALVSTTDAPGRLLTDGRSIWFLEAVRDAVSGVAQLCTDAARAFEWDDNWCDVFLTEGSSSIGSHIDDSDNFTMQLEGTKDWRLGAPAAVSKLQQRLRLLGEPDVGDAQISEDCSHFTLEPGDVLYIPLLWRHWGVSRSDSLSVSLVINSATVWEALHSTLTDELRHEPAWQEPLAVGPSTRAARRAQLTGVIAALPDSGATARLRRRAQREAASSMRVRRSGQLEVDMEWVRHFVGSAPEVPHTDLVLPTATRAGLDSTTALNRLLARKNLRDLLKLVHSRFGQTTSGTDRRLLQSCVNVLPALAEPELERVLIDPDAVSWIAVAKRGTGPLPTGRREDPLAHQLAFVLLPEILAHVDDAGLVPEITVDAGRDGGLALRRLGVAIAPASTTGFWRLIAESDGMLIGDGGEDRLVPLADHPRATSLATIADGPTVVPSPSAWLDQHLPATEELIPANPSSVKSFLRQFSAAAELLTQLWPEAWREVRECVSWLIPIEGAGLRPRNHSVHAFRGLLVSSARPAPMAAQTLVHETGHNRMSTIIDLLPLCTNPNDRAISPVVNADRPLSAVFHGCYSFAREVYLTQLMVDRGIADVPGTSMPRYLRERTEIVRDAWKLLRQRAYLRPAGETILAEVETILDSIGR